MKMNPEEAWFTRIVTTSLKNNMLKNLYLKRVKFFNYAFVGGCGVIINTVILYILVGYLPLYLANWIAILVAWLSNFMCSVGPFGHLFGLSEKTK